MSQSRHRAAAVLLLAVPHIAVAAESGSVLDNLVVTANRQPVRDSRALAPVSVIDRDTIERSLAADLSELLRFQAGLDVVRTGGAGQQTSIFTRGTESNHTLVLVDGVRINNGSLGSAAIENISPNMIAQVEIVKAPRTSLYGEDAIGGVINVITRRPAGNALELFAGAGRYDTRRLGLAASSRAGPYDFGVRLQGTQTDGYPIVDGEDLDRGHDNVTLSGHAAGNFAGWDAALRFWQSTGKTEYFAIECADPFCDQIFNAPRDQDYTNRAVALSASAEIGPNWQSIVDLSFVTDDVDQNQSTDFAKTERWILDWQNNFTLNENHLLMAGVYLSREKVDSTSFGVQLDTEDADVDAVFLADNIEVGRHALVLAARYSNHDAFGADLTWNVEYGLDILPTLRFTAGAGRAVRAPSAVDRFSPFAGNPDLDQEDAYTIEAGLRWQVGQRSTVSLNVFRTEVEDLIETALIDDPAGSGFPVFKLQNIGEAEIGGVEAEYRYAGQSWSWRAEGIFQNPENKSDGSTLLRRAEQSFTLGLTKNLGEHQVGFDLLAVGTREDFAGKLAGYVLANLTGLYTVSERWRVRGRVENLLDRDYTVAFYDFASRYRSPGRSLYVELHYNWQ